MESDLISAFADAVAARVIAHLSTFPTAAPPAAPASQWMTPQEAAAYIKLAPATLERRRCVGGDGPRFERNGHRVRYLRSALDEWLSTREEKRAAKPPAPRAKNATPPSPRDAAIAAAHAKGVTLAELGREFKLTRERVRQIVARGKR